MVLTLVGLRQVSGGVMGVDLANRMTAFFSGMLLKFHPPMAGSQLVVRIMPVCFPSDFWSLMNITLFSGYFGALRGYFGSSREYFGALRSYFHPSRGYFGALRNYFGSLREYFGALSRYFHASSAYFGKLSAYFYPLSTHFHF